MTSPAGPSGSADTARELLFADVLACDELRPAAFLPGEVDGPQRRSCLIRAETLLRAMAIVEDGTRPDENEPAHDNALRRIEAKLDLLTALVANVAPPSADPVHPLRWSARGARLPVAAPLPAQARGLFRVQPADWLPSTLQLPAVVLACGPDGSAGGAHVAWLRFEPMGPALEAALERHLFRVHRRAVAESRRPG